jgi:hypothetical protein
MKNISPAWKLKAATSLEEVGSQSIKALLPPYHLNYSMLKTLIISKTKHLVLNDSLTTNEPRTFWHVINKKPEPKFLEIPPGQSILVCFSVSVRIDAASVSGESQPLVAWQTASTTPARSWRPRDPAAQHMGKHSDCGQLCPRESWAPLDPCG